MFGDVWLRVTRGDPRALGLYNRHYSASLPKDRRRRSQFAPPGETLILLTPGGDALFGWVRNTVERYDHQVGVNCFVFRNESAQLSSDLVLAAMARAWERWPQQRLFTYVDPRRVRSRNPGYCFLVAGWKRCGRSPKGLILLEALPSAPTKKETISMPTARKSDPDEPVKTGPSIVDDARENDSGTHTAEGTNTAEDEQTPEEKEAAEKELAEQRSALKEPVAAHYQQRDQGGALPEGDDIEPQYLAEAEAHLATMDEAGMDELEAAYSEEAKSASS